MSRWFRTPLILGIVFSLAPDNLVQPAMGETEQGSLVLRVLVFNDAAVPAEVLEKAQEFASVIYRYAGIETVWCPYRSPADGRIRPSDCKGLFGPQYLVIRILPVSDGKFTTQGDAFGLALIGADGGFSRHAYVFFDQVKNWRPEELWQSGQGRLAGRIPMDVLKPLLLAVVMSHEMGHLLLGSNSHSQGGIMCGRWTRSTLEEAYWGDRVFIPDQVRRLQENIRDRISAQQVANLAGEPE